MGVHSPGEAHLLGGSVGFVMPGALQRALAGFFGGLFFFFERNAVGVKRPPTQPGCAAAALQGPHTLGTSLSQHAGGPAPEGRPPPHPPPAVHILLGKISLLCFQVPAEMRLKNVQNAVFPSFPLCVSQRVLQTGHFLIVSLWLSCSGIREAFIFRRKKG